jgi:hypothetical protein
VTGQAARGYSWPTATPGNRIAEKHGAYSERRWRPEAERLRSTILGEAPWLTRPAFALAVAAWSVAEAKAAVVDAWLDEHGLLTDDGEPRPANALSDRLHARANSLRGVLGLDPVSFSKLLATFAGVPGGEDALAALRAEGRRLVEARSALPVGTVDTSDLTSEAQASAQGPSEAAQ